MQTVLRTLEGPVTISSDMELLGVATGTVTVPSGVHLVMQGMIMGDLIVEQGGRATVNGTVTGVILDHGGEVQVFGVVGALRDAQFDGEIRLA